MELLLCPSMMCADIGNLRSEMKLLEEAGADLFHIDVMDGQYVPNFGMGRQDIEYICRNGKIPSDIHLMIQNPSNYIDLFAAMKPEIIYIHPESDIHCARTLQRIAGHGIKPGIAVNPGTSLETVRELLYLVDYIMVMTVNPGFAGQDYLEYVNNKLLRLMEYKKEFSFDVIVDGAVSLSKIRELKEIGVRGFVLGTSTLFGKPEDYTAIFEKIKKI